MTERLMPKEFRVPGSWTAMNDVEEASDGKMYWAILEYTDDDTTYCHSVTGYDLTPEVAWEVVRSRNEAMRLEQDSRGFWYRP